MASANGNNSNLMAKVNNKPSQQGMTPEQTVQHYLKLMGPEIAKALPKHLNADRLARIALTTIRTTPKLLSCNMQSLMAAVMQSAQLGLEPGLLGHCYIIPYGSEAQFIIGYKGMIDLARRSGDIESIVVEPVYQNDYFKFERGLASDEFKHIPWDMREDEEFEEPGELVRVYLIARFKSGGYYFHRMSKQQIDNHRKRSKASSSGPWVTDYEEMAKKTVVRSAWKYLPISVEVMQQVAATDETVKKEIKEDMTAVPNIIDMETGEIVPQDVPARTDESEPTDEESLFEKHKRLTKNL